MSHAHTDITRLRQMPELSSVGRQLFIFGGKRDMSKLTWQSYWRMYNISIINRASSFSNIPFNYLHVCSHD
uniref:Uncharacterized protein n=1 Tax=Arundo donax TaxID=35708 RepID=A0A0A9GFY2_ARUDO